MRIFKIILGVLIIAALFAVIFMYVVIAQGIINAILVFAVTAVVTLVTYLGMKLIVNNIKE